MSGPRDKRRAVWLSFIMIMSVFGATVALSGSAIASPGNVGIGNAGTPVDIPGGQSSTTQQLASVPIDVNGASDSTQHAVKVDISELQDAGVDLSNAEVGNVNVNVDNDVDGETASVAVQRVDAGAAEVRLVITISQGTNSGDDIDFEITDLTLSGLDTTGVTTAKGNDYLVLIEDGNSGSFGGGFSPDSILTSQQFDISSIEVENLNTGTTIVETDLTAAIDEADGNDDFDAADNVEIRLPNGTFVTGNNDLDDGDGLTRIVAISGATPVIQNSGASPTLTLNEDTEIEGITFDQNDNNNDALRLDTGADVTLTDVIFQNPGTGSSDLVLVDDESGTVDIQNATFDGADEQNADGLTIQEDSGGDGGASITVEESTFQGLAIGVDASTDLDSTTGLDSFTLSNNDFAANNQVQVEDDNDNPSVGLDTIFNQNTFNEFVVIRNDVDNSIVDDNQHAIYGGFQFAPEADLDNADTTTVLSAGSHTWDTTVTVPGGNNNVDFTAASGVVANNVTVDVTVAEAIDVDGNIEDLSVTGLTFDVDDNHIIEDVGDNDPKITGLTVTDNQLVNINDMTGDNALIELGDQVVSATISDNTFDAATDAGNAYTAVDIGEFLDDGSSATLDISNNVINGTENDAIQVRVVDSDASNPLTLSVTDNTIRVSDTVAGIDADSLNTNDNEEIIVERNIITAGDGGTDGTGIELSAAGDTGGNGAFSVSNNDVSGFDNVNGIGVDISDNNLGTFEATIQNNEFENNGVQVNFDSGNDVISVNALKSANEFIQLVELFDQEGGTLVTDEVYGTIAGAVNDVSANEFVAVRPGTYDETSVNPGQDGVTIEATAGPSETTVTSTDGSTIFNLDNDGVTLRGFTIDSSGNTATDEDVLANNGDGGSINIINNIFVGFEDRTAIEADGTQSVVVERNEISGYLNAVLVDSDDDTNIDVVENQIIDNTRGVDIQGGSTADANVNFNSIVNNDIGLQNDETDDNKVTALANWWGNPSGPSGENPSGTNLDGQGDELDNNDDSTIRVKPWLTGPVANLSTDQYVVVTDPTNPVAGNNNVDITVAVLNETLRQETTATDTVLISNPSNPVRSLAKDNDADGNTPIGSAAEPFQFRNVNIIQADDFTMTAKDADGDVPQGSSIQTISGVPDNVSVTVERDTLVADGDTTVNATLQVIDSDGNPVDANNEDVTFLIDNSSNADVTRVATETSTDSNGQAQIEISAQNSGFQLEITGVFDNDDTTAAPGSSDVATVETVSQELNASVSPQTVTANNSTELTIDVTGIATGATVEDATVELSGAGVSQTLLTNANGTATTTVNASSVGTIDVNVSADGFADVTESISVEEPEAPPTATVTFDNQTVQNGSTSVNVASARFDGTEDFVIVVHRASPGDNGVVDSTDEIGNKIGSSDVLSGNVSDVSVNLTKSLDEGGNTQLTEDQTLIAMLHFANESRPGDTNFGSPIVRNGTPVFDQAEITVEDTVNVGGEDVPVEFTTTTENGETTVTATNAIDAIDAFRNDNANVSTVLSVIDAFRDESSQ